jgi:hypothetical protein
MGLSDKNCQSLIRLSTTANLGGNCGHSVNGRLSILVEKTFLHANIIIPE